MIKPENKECNKVQFEHLPSQAHIDMPDGQL